MNESEQELFKYIEHSLKESLRFMKYLHVFFIIWSILIFIMFLAILTSVF